MIALRWLYLLATADQPDRWLPEHGGPARCVFCAGACPDAAPSQPARVALRDTFTNHDLARHPAGDWLCPACAWYMDHGATRAPGSLADVAAARERGGLHGETAPLTMLTNASWRVTPTTAVRWQRERMRGDLEVVLATAGPLAEPAVFAIALSKKKHILPLALATYSGGAVTVQVEQERVTLTRAEWTAITAPFDRLRALGHFKGEIVRGALSPVALARHGRIAEAIWLSAHLDAWRTSQALSLVAYVSPAEVEMEGEMTTTPTGLEMEQPATDGNLNEYGGVGTGGGYPTGGVGGHQPGVQEPLPPRHLATTTKSRRRSGAHDQRPRVVSQPPLWAL